MVAVRKGRFGPYVQHGKTVANLPRGVMMEDITLDEAVALLAEKGKQLRPRGAGLRTARCVYCRLGEARIGSGAGSERTGGTQRPSLPKRRATKAKRTTPKEGRLRHAAKKKAAAREGKKAKKQGGGGSKRLPETVIVAVTGTDPDGDAVARPAGWEPGTVRRLTIFMAAEPCGQPGTGPRRTRACAPEAGGSRPLRGPHLGVSPTHPAACSASIRRRAHRPHRPACQGGMAGAARRGRRRGPGRDRARRTAAHHHAWA